MISVNATSSIVIVAIVMMVVVVMMIPVIVVIVIAVRAVMMNDGDDAANCDGDGDHSGHLCRIASHVGNELFATRSPNSGR